MTGGVAARKQRTKIPQDVAALVLFESDRTCCVCRVPGKRIQIHHLDDDPSNHDAKNLAVLCTDCHDETHQSGGFARKLNADQIRLYREDWHQTVAQHRAWAVDGIRDIDDVSDARQVELATSIAETYR
ncbi:MAG TPA: hypothetical protein VMK12_03410, partial [Anaeromyxobacteraceae bacterium]|nr:hypothetical protein [Anaeromyxobacteraceae bacterium]